MHENIFKIHAGRLKKFTTENYMDIYPESIVLKAEYARTENPVPYQERLKLHYQPVTEGTVWGSAWDSAWFHVTGKVPESFAGKELCLRLKTDSEILLFDAKGDPLCGLTHVSVYDTHYCKERFNIGVLKAGAKIDYWFECAANGLTGIHLAPPEEREPAHPLGVFSPAVKSLRLCVFNREVWLFLLEMETLYDMLEKLGPDDYHGKQLMYAMTKAADVYGYAPANVSEARKVLQELIFRRKGEEGGPVANTIGHAHIDLAWLWPLRESTRKAARTFSSQIGLMQEYPEYRFGASQPYLYKQVKENYPGLYKKIKKSVKDGLWELQGGMFVEADCNLISGESMVRQFLHGKNFFMDEFGVDVKTLWIPDVFGYSGAMPQIIRKAGCDYFLTQKISWSQVNKFPYHTFRWFGVDGSEVLTHFPPENTYNASILPGQRITAANRFNEAGFLPGFMSLAGIGDGGGGPSDNYLERSRMISDLRGCPKAQWRFASDYFEDVQKYEQELPQWHGELYLEYHRGTLTTQSRTKRGNRKCEQALVATEALAASLSAQEWRREELDSVWKTLLTNQFHDIIPGSSIRQVYERTEKEHAEILAWTEKEQTRVFKLLFRKNAKSAVLANTLSCEWSGLAELPERWKGVSVLDESGTELPVHVSDGKTYVSVRVPGLSFKTIFMGGKARSVRKNAGNFVLENALVRYETNREGHLVHAFDKQLQKEFLAGEGNVLTLYPDRPLYFEAWDVDLYYRNGKTARPVCVSASNAVKSDAAVSAEFLFRTERSEIRQKVVLPAHSKRLDFITEVDWQEDRTMLRTSFPVTVRSEAASFDIQYAYIERPTHNNTSWDEAKFETCGQRYADLSDDSCGAALMNDCKYGYYVKGSTLDLALLRSPKYPDRFADQGKHLFTYSFLPHTGTLAESNVMQEGANLNRCVIVADGFEAGKAAFPCRLEADGISVETVKRGEKSDDLIVRLVETCGKSSGGVLTFAQKVQKVSETDLLEWKELASVPVHGNQVTLAMKPFEIRTLKISFGRK